MVSHQVFSELNSCDLYASSHQLIGNLHYRVYILHTATTEKLLNDAKTSQAEEHLDDDAAAITY